MDGVGNSYHPYGGIKNPYEQIHLSNGSLQLRSTLCFDDY